MLYYSIKLTINYLLEKDGAKETKTKGMNEDRESKKRKRNE